MTSGRQWGEWSDFHPCDVSCGGGTQLRTRVCKSPPNAPEGLDCLSSDGSGLRATSENETYVCNTQKCPGNAYVRTPYASDYLK